MQRTSSRKWKPLVDTSWSFTWDTSELVDDGSVYTVAVTAADNAGNTSTIERNVYVDRAPPLVTLDGEDAACRFYSLHWAYSPRVRSLRGERDIVVRK